MALWVYVGTFFSGLSDDSQIRLFELCVKNERKLQKNQKWIQIIRRRLTLWMTKNSLNLRECGI